MDSLTNKRLFSGYSLLEVMGVLTILVILGGISYGTFSGIQAAKMKSIAKAEIALISQALNSFYSKYGDYPVTEGVEKNAITLSKSLLGWKIFKGNPPKMIDLTEIPPEGIEAFIEVSKLLYTGNLSLSDKAIPNNVQFIDPWGNPYVYAYKDSKNWDNYTFIIYSKGPDGIDEKIDENGVQNEQFKSRGRNADNIYLED